MGPILELKNITKAHDGKTALKGISVEVREGEVLSIIGPNASGKTTLLRIMALLDPPTSGDILFKGKKISSSGAEQLRGRITMVFQRTVLFNTTVFKNISYGLKLQGYSKTEIKKRVNEALDLVGLKNLADRRAKKLSGGEQQRVAIARALALQPELMLLDEPTANIDPPNVAIIEKLIKDLRGKIAIVVTTHNLFQARRISDRIACLLDGTLIYEGNPEEVFERPKDERIKSFINGWM